MFHAGFFVCPYVRNGFCPVEDGMFAIDTRKGGTNRFGRHTDVHKKNAGFQVVQRQLAEKCRETVSEAAAMAVLMDLRPFGFAENHEGIAKYAEAVFKAGQTVPYGANISPSSYLPSRTAVRNALGRITTQMKNSFALKFESTLKSLGGAVTIDGLHLKLQGRHYYDLTIHHMNIHKKAVVTEGTEFTIKTTTILFLEGPEKPTASNIIQLLDTNLQQQYKITYGDIAKDFTFVTDGAAVMANVGGSSVSLRLARRDQRWMRCFAHVLSKVMEKAMLNCKNDPVLIKIHTDFKMMKRVVENSKRVPWNHMLPNGYRLIQEVDTRFGTHYLQNSSQPKLHEILPAVQHCLRQLSRIEHGDFVVRDDGTTQRPTLHSMRLCGVMKSELQKIEIHDLWLVACFLYPYLRDMNFWDNEIERLDFRNRGEALTRAMISQGQTESQQVQDGVGQVGVGVQSRPNTGEPLQKQRRYSLWNHVSREDTVPADSDEVSTYKSTPLRQMNIKQEKWQENLRVFATPASSCASERVFSIVNKLVTRDKMNMSPENISQIVVARSLSQYNFWVKYGSNCISNELFRFTFV